jgi:hypothetical protein
VYFIIKKKMSFVFGTDVQKRGHFHSLGLPLTTTDGKQKPGPIVERFRPPPRYFPPTWVKARHEKKSKTLKKVTEDVRDLVKRRKGRKRARNIKRQFLELRRRIHVETIDRSPPKKASYDPLEKDSLRRLTGNVPKRTQLTFNELWNTLFSWYKNPLHRLEAFLYLTKMVYRSQDIRDQFIFFRLTQIVCTPGYLVELLFMAQFGVIKIANHSKYFRTLRQLSWKGLFQSDHISIGYLTSEFMRIYGKKILGIKDTKKLFTRYELNEFSRTVRTLKDTFYYYEIYAHQLGSLKYDLKPVPVKEGGNIREHILATPDMFCDYYFNPLPRSIRFSGGFMDASTLRNLERIANVRITLENMLDDAPRFKKKYYQKYLNLLEFEVRNWVLVYSGLTTNRCVSLADSRHSLPIERFWEEMLSAYSREIRDVTKAVAGQTVWFRSNGFGNLIEPIYFGSRYLKRGFLDLRNPSAYPRINQENFTQSIQVFKNLCEKAGVSTPIQITENPSTPLRKILVESILLLESNRESVYDMIRQVVFINAMTEAGLITLSGAVVKSKVDIINQYIVKLINGIIVPDLEKTFCDHIIDLRLAHMKDSLRKLFKFEEFANHPEVKDRLKKFVDPISGEITVNKDVITDALMKTVCKIKFVRPPFRNIPQIK